MDVRCERCQTEYELEDETVTEGGVPVQCTSCGHTFIVTRPTPAPSVVPRPGAGPGDAGLPPADWLLETSDGQLHRFRNLTSLQKWIVERKVTRDDKISRTGQAWRRLGEIVELAPFFDVVDEADRARAQEAAARELKLEAEQARRAGARPSPARSIAVADGSSGRATPSPPAAAVDAPVGFAGVPLGMDDLPPEIATHVVRSSRSGVKVFAFILVAGLVAAGGVYAFRGGTAAAPTATDPPPTRATAADQPPTPAVAPATPAATTAAAPSPVPPAPAAAVPAPSAPAPVAAAPTPAPAEPAPAPASAAGEAAPSYERLIGDADRQLENGNTERAAKLYEKALKAQPSGVEAIAGLGYVMLDRGRSGQAVAQFKRALAQAPSFGPALYGLAEAHRAAGDVEPALELYRRYVASHPSGPEVHAAERQIKALEAQAKAAREQSRPTDPSAAPASPSSVLGESAPASP